jgi:hypothetical protein
LDVVVKLLPFAEKLEMFNTIPVASATHLVVYRQLLSDLVDEQQAMLRHSCEFGNIPVEDLLLLMPALRAFKEYNFSTLAQSGGDVGKRRMLDILLRVRALASLYPKRGIFQKTFLWSTVKGVTESVATRYGGLHDVKAFKNAKNALRKNESSIFGNGINSSKTFDALKDPAGFTAHNIALNNWSSLDRNDIITSVEKKRERNAASLVKDFDKISTGDFHRDCEGYLKRCIYRRPMPVMYPDLRGQFGAKDDNGITGSFVVESFSE